MGWVPNVTMMTVGPNSGKQSRPSDVTTVMLMTVVVGARKRPLNHAHVEALMRDIQRQGLLQPIGVRASSGSRGGPLQLIYGYHRLVAFSALGPEYDAIPAIIFPSDMPDWQIELAEISENLIRRELTPAEREAQEARYAALMAHDSPKAGKKMATKSV